MNSNQFKVLKSALDFRKGVRFSDLTIGIARSMLIVGIDNSPDRYSRRLAKKCANVLLETKHVLESAGFGDTGNSQIYHHFTKTANQLAIDLAAHVIEHGGSVKLISESNGLNSQSVYNAIENLKRISTLRQDWEAACQL